MQIKNTVLYRYDDRRDIAIPGDQKVSLIFAVEHFIICAKHAIESKGSFFVALSGGSTPKAIFDALSAPPYSKKIDWSKVWLFWGDERSVPPDHSDSNYRMAMEAGFQSLPIPKEQIFRMEAESNIEENAKKYETLIKEKLKGEAFDLIMLGMGEDGHTASLFPGTKGLHETKRLVIANEVPQHKTWRMTLTFPFINEAKNIAIYVLGASKKEMLKKVLLQEKPTDTYPITRIGTAEHRALWIADTAAAELLSAHFKP